MKTTVKRTLSILLTVSLLLCFTVVPLNTFAYGKRSHICLPHTGAAWKSWAQGGGTWANIPIGAGTTITMAQQGCVLTSIAMAAKSYGIKQQGMTTDSVTPKTFVEKCKQTGVDAVTSTGAYYWGRTNRVLKSTNGSSSWKVEGLTTVNAMTAKVKEYLEKTDGQYIVIVCFNGAHYVAADHVSGDTLYVFDPAVGAVTTLQTALNRKSSYSLSGFFYLKYTDIIRGDVDGSGIIDSTDARLVLQYVEGRIATLPYLSVADFNANGSVDAADVTLLLSHAAGG